MNLRTIREADVIQLAATEMAHDEIHHLIVVDHAGKLVGLVSDRDLLRARGRGGDVLVGEVMSRDLAVVGPGTPAVLAAERMLRGKHSALPVVDDGGHPIGIVTSTDFLEIAYQALAGIEPSVPRARA